MTRLLLVALIVSLGLAPVAYADGLVLASAKRAAQDLAKSQTLTPAAPSTDTAVRAAGVQAGGRDPGAGGWSKAKTWIAIGVAGVFAAGAVVIQSKGEDTTPSNLGTRQDGAPAPPRVQGRPLGALSLSDHGNAQRALDR